MGRNQKRRFAHTGGKTVRSLCYRRSEPFFQLNLPRYNIAVIVLRCRSNRIQDLRPLVPELLGSMPAAKLGDVLWIGKTNH